MSVLDRSSLEASPLADLHTIASELSIDGYRRLRRAELIAAILDRQGGANGAAPIAAIESGPPPGPEVPTDESEPEIESMTDADEEPSGARRRRGRRGGRGRAAPREDETERDEAPALESSTERDQPEAGEQDEPEPRPRTGPRARTEPRERSRVGERTEVGERPEPPARARSRKASRPEPEPEAVPETVSSTEDELVEGVVELLANGSGFVRVDPPDPSDDDVYISSAQVKRCELVSGDRIAGPKRTPRRSERFASLVRIETINGRPASELADSVRYDDLPAAFPDQRLKIDSDDPTLKAIEWLTPFGLGSRVTIVGAPRSGKTEALRRLADALAGRDELALTVVLAGVRPEEISEWNQGPVKPAAAVGLGGTEDAHTGAIEPVIDQARRLAARGADAVVLIDTLAGVNLQVARKALASARNIVDGGSLTVIATAGEPLGGETTVVALDVALTSVGRFPALDILTSGTLRPELLVGQAGADAIARTRAEAYEGDDG